MPKVSSGKLPVLFAILAIPFSQAFAQTIRYPDTIFIQVTYYDFHSNQSNPEFEKIPTGTPVHLGMVGDTLDTQRKPVLGANPYWDCQIAKWFRPYVQGTPSNYIIPNYLTPVTTGCGNLITIAYDTAFKNVVIHDSLPFTHPAGAAAGVYQYYNPSFFPLDGRGFQNEGRSHNYSFTMELHKEFTKVQGLTFQFEGDDDVWAFINNKLVMDIGGIHNTTADSVIVDKLGLIDKTKYMFDFFYAERHVTGSDIKITTNFFTPTDIGIKMSAYPDKDTIPS